MAQARQLVAEPATAEALAEYGQFLAAGDAVPLVPVSFYGGAVHVHQSVPFESQSAPQFSVCRLARRPLEIEYVERHPLHTQAFIPLGGKPFVAVMAPPSVSDLPEVSQLRAFLFDGSAGFVMNAMTWHEFPFALEDDTDIVVVLSEETSANLKPDNVIAGEAIGPDLEKRNWLARGRPAVQVRLA